MTASNTLLVTAALFGCCFFTGCGNATSASLGKVEGAVTVDGAPVAGLSVLFQPAEGRPSEGFTDDAGRYTLTYVQPNDGAVIGTHTVRIESPPGPEAVHNIPAKYNSKSELTAEVKSGSNTHNFELTSK